MKPCPVCRNTVITNAGGICIARHRDKAGTFCPAEGFPIRICERGDE